MIVAWQGWKIEVPDRWGPVRLEGDADAGYLLMADLHRPRLGIRWKKEASRRFQPQKAAKAALVGELGQLAANESSEVQPPIGEWQAPLLYEEPEPPGRDVWIGYSTTSSRMFQVVYHAHRRERTLQDKLLPGLEDGTVESMRDWSIFELSCRVPEGMRVVKQRLNAGDLGLQFLHKDKRTVNVRQIAVAKLALQRRPLERWILDQATWRGNKHRPGDEVEELQAEPRLLRQVFTRRLRSCWMYWLEGRYFVYARHDAARDRLVLVDAPTEELAEQVLESVGWAQAGR